jgi:ribosome-associated protein YbcJ (S4-like RNA binding protein)
MIISNFGRDEHFNRSPECAFFTLINNHKQSPAAKRTKSKRDRTSKASRLSTQSSFTVASEAPSVTDLPAGDEDSILTTATNATTTQGKNMGKLKKTYSAKGRKTKVKKGEPLEVVAAPEPEDDDFEVKVDTAPKTTRGKKRKSDEASEPTALAIDIEAPAPKRRATRTRGTMAVDDSVVGHVEQEAPKSVGQKRRSSAKTSRKASAASVALLKANVPDDDEIDMALEADLNRPLVDEHEVPSEPPIVVSKKAARASKTAKDGQAMFGVDRMELDEAEIEAELEAMEIDSKPLPKAKGAKGKQPRKVSAKQQAAAKKAAEADAEAQRLAEEEASQQIAAELEHSISMQHSSPVIQPKKQRASRQPSRQTGGRSTRGSVLSVNENNITLTDDNLDPDGQKEDPGNETDASMASQSTIVRGGATRRGSTMKKGKGGKKAASRNIEEIVHKSVEQTASMEVNDHVPSTKGKKVIHTEEISIVEETYYTPAPEAPAPAPEVEEPTPKVVKTKAFKMPGRPAKTAPSSQPSQAEDTTMGVDVPTKPKAKQTKAKAAAPPPRAPTPPPRERTPSESAQSSDAENHPPSSKPSAATKKTTTPHSTRRVPLASTPNMSPSKRNVIASLQSSNPWSSVDLDAIFMKSPGGENSVGNMMDIFGGAIEKAKVGDLTSPEKRMTVEEWIHHNAEMAEEKLRNECERMVGTFEREGTRAMRALEGVECVE